MFVKIAQTYETLRIKARQYDKTHALHDFD